MRQSRANMILEDFNFEFCHKIINKNKILEDGLASGMVFFHPIENNVKEIENLNICQGRFCFLRQT